ncbi:DUF2807 domain-containing protein [uncultured Chryseobacterium sp.]|uniref:GIN domain-containing protein n=1 Tax=uncultured Chryseobacterium sp. TaxID=259322 RepID=UPI0025D27477|nr:DUF2807 domain-containing protein [uncultured Chryseobacterium sp.]
MNSKTIFIFSALVMLGACNKDDRRGAKKDSWVETTVSKENGSLQEREFRGEFDEIEVSQAIEADIIKADAERVVVSAPQDLIDEVLVENKNGKLHIHYKSGVRVTNNRVTAKIYTKDFEKLTANSAAEIRIKDSFTQEKTKIDLSSSGSVSGNLEANKFDISAGSSSSFSGKIWAVDLDIDASSGSSIDISGKSKRAELSSSSGSSISARDIVADRVKAEASSGGSIDISAVSELDAEASSGGSVNVYKKGNLKTINQSQSSGGSVNIQ